MIGTLNRSTWLTHLGLLVALFGMWSALTGTLTWALIALVVAGLIDLADGPVARAMTRTEAQKRFGVQLDTAVDVVSFLALPAVIAFAIARLEGGLIVLPATAFYVVAGVTRLAAFTADTSAEGPSRTYRGLPVTYAALVLPVASLVTFWVDGRRATDRVLPQHVVLAPVWTVAMVCLAMAFIVDLPVLKPRGLMYAVFGLLAIAVVTGLVLVG